MPENSPTDLKGPAVKFPPPLVFIGYLLGGYALQLITPIGFGMALWGKFIGTALVTGSMALLSVLLTSYLREKTSIESWKPTSHLITTGLYRYSRNPIYTALCLINVGVGCYLNSLWIVLSFLPSALTVYFIAIRKEEIYLKSKFGTQYVTYMNNVRRWL